MSERFVSLTDLLGERVWVAPAWVQMVIPAGDHWSLHSGVAAGSVVHLSGVEYAVRETVDEVYDKLCAVPWESSSGS